jgi:competence protein ComEA
MHLDRRALMRIITVSHRPLGFWLWLSFVAMGVVSGAAPAQSVDLNTADVATLSRDLLGIGETRARAIVEHRRRHGPFRSVDELALVRGIGPKTVDRNRARMRVSGDAPPPARTAPARGTQGTAAAAAQGLRRLPRSGASADETTPEILVGQ